MEDHQQEGLPLTRRAVLAGAGAGALALAAPDVGKAAVPQVPMLDTHIHLFDPTRPQGAPYRGPKDKPFYTQGAFPSTYREVMRRYPIVGAIKVEASPWIEDNLWALETAERDTVMVGTIGNFRIEQPDFPEYLARYAKNPLFRGVRYGNLWRYDIGAQSRRQEFIDGLKRVADADLVMDTSNPTLDLLQAVLRINDRLPDLRIVIDHLCKYDPAPAEQADYEAVLREMQHRPSLFVKLSSNLHADHVSPRMTDHKAMLDRLFAAFGEDRVLFASDWPNVEGDGSVHTEIAIVQEYFAGKSLAQREKFFWRNSIAAYKWKPRTTAQQKLYA